MSIYPADYWLIRTVDLVREPLTYAVLVLGILALLVNGMGRWVAVALFGVTALINTWRIWPYSALAGEEIPQITAADAEAAQCFTALSVNVKVKNTDFDQVAAQIEEVSPDILLLMETDANWISELRGVLSDYSYTLEEPQPHAFGMVFASRLPAVDARMVENTSRDTPTLYATVNLPNGEDFEFIGLHPKPPLPGWNTEERDANIVRAGTETPASDGDALVMGDFNDVPWSRTTTRFREEGGWRDPRIGRGTYPTFPANLTVLGWPLDQIMLRGALDLRDFRVMPDNGSDHRAIRATLCQGDRAQG
ncbi:endonuclease/exonuclease/phosphatase family protein [Aurantiacibacter poecillastricola]|uniref:endonuclease/exonuclease/phosphatase family protein n=1 Tax=Aurantiacibacter poecillastricola TaxID=3064385 RepID=UPI00273F2F01|nr:endonuclease/exonuclease/phosphatase family protein [Aurantiacibacter sp. 219JJ12-13]MDP5261010.1 endonuclease/exonuclease/phosphatase family protein [Aurantiacibacter sp. 219JJ12-13]